MKLSIVVPVYNVENYIEQCLDSLLNQSYDDIEIVCVNDGSTDKSLLKLEQYKEMNPNKIKIVNKKNGGLSDARNFGIDNSSGEYIGFVDADDWISETMYEKLITKAMEENAEVVVCDYIEVYSDEEKIIKDNNKGYKMLYESLVCNKIFKRELFNANNIRFPLNLWYEDNATTYKLLFLAKQVSKCEEALYYYRRTRENSIMNSQFSERIYDMWKIGENLSGFFNAYNLTEVEAKQVEYIFIKNIMFRQVPKIIKYELPNPFKVKKMLKENLRVIEKDYPMWYKNEILISDPDKYFKNKIGTSYMYKLKLFKNVFSL